VERSSGLVAAADTECWSSRGTRIGLRIFALRSSAAVFCHRDPSTANAQGHRNPIKAKGARNKQGNPANQLNAFQQKSSRFVMFNDP